MSHILLLRYHVAGLPEDQIKSNKFISETADLKIEIQDNDNVQSLTEVRKGCCHAALISDLTSNTVIILMQ